MEPTVQQSTEQNTLGYLIYLASLGDKWGKKTFPCTLVSGFSFSFFEYFKKIFCFNKNSYFEYKTSIHLSRKSSCSKIIIIVGDILRSWVTRHVTCYFCWFSELRTYSDSPVKAVPNNKVIQ